MQTLLAELAISMSDFKKNPAAVLRRAQGAPVAVLNHNRVGFYMLEPHIFERMMAELARSPSSSADTSTAGAARTSRQVIDDLLSQAKAGPD